MRPVSAMATMKSAPSASRRAMLTLPSPTRAPSSVEPAGIAREKRAIIRAGSTELGALVGDGSVSIARLLALGALFIVAIAETGRIPVDNPDTHLELTMAHEGMLLEYSGRPLGLLLWGTHVKQLVILSLLAAIFFPWPWGTAG